MEIAELNNLTGLGFLYDKRLQKVAIISEMLLFLLFAKFEVDLGSRPISSNCGY